MPGAAPFMRLMVAKLRSDAGSRDTAREIYRQVREQAEDSQTRENAELRLLQLDSLDERDSINKVLGEFRASRGRCPSGWNEIVPMLARVSLPGGRDFSVNARGEVVDPTGAAYLISSSEGECRAELDKEATRIPLK